MDIQYFLILIFVFWVLEGLAKAKQRGRQAEEQEETGGLDELPQAERREEPRVRRPPALPDEAAEPRSRPVQAPRRPRNLWEEIQEIARQQQETDRQRRQQPEPQGQRRHEPAARPLPVEAAPSAEEVSGERAAAARVEADFGVEERRSDRWTSGSAREAEPAPAGPALPVPTTPATLAPARPPKHATVLSARPRRASLRERTEAPTRVAVAPGHQRALDPLALPRLSREELRRLLMLQEILGPPVALRDKAPGEHD